MTDTPAHSATTLLFQAPPPPPPGDGADDLHETYDAPAGRGGSGRDRGTPPSGAPSGRPGELRMLKGARAAATGMHISDEQIRAVLENPEELKPDPRSPQRTQLTGDGLVVTTGQDGMILRVARRGRSGRSTRASRPGPR